MDHHKPEYIITELAEKWQKGVISPEEKAYYENWYASFNDEELILSNPRVENPEFLEALLYDKLIQRIDREERKPLKINSWRKWYSIAAILVMILTGLILFNDFRTPSGPITPGKNTAVLTLADGKVISLSDQKNGIVIDAAHLIYTDGTALNQGDKNLALTKNMTVSTPRGGTYQIGLPDGSQVWLNAASSITFPSNFDGLPDRRVEVKGEAYFEISKSYVGSKEHRQRRAFIVKAGNQEIEVLGTHFNVKAYADETGVRTTLLEGSVRVAVGNSTKIIVPGQQAFSFGRKIDVAEVNAGDAIAWKKGNFQFNDEDIETVMSAVSRWYNVDVVYQGVVTKERFGGTISRSKPITEVLASLEETGYVKFKIEGRRVIVMS